MLFVSAILGVSVYLFVLFYLASTLRKLNKPPENNHVVSLNLIIPFRNEIENLSVLLEYLIEHKEDILKLNQLIFVNDHSSDYSDDLIHDFIKEIPFENITLINNQESHIGKKRAIFNALQHSKADFVLTLDADSIPQKGWINAWLELLEKNVQVHLGAVRVKEEVGALNSFQVVENALLQFITASTAILEFPVMANGAHLCYSYRLMNSDNSFNYSILSGDDADVLTQAKKQKHGFRYQLSEKIRVTTKAPDTVRDFLAQKRRWISKVFKNVDLGSLLGVLLVIVRIIFPIYLVLFPSILSVCLFLIIIYSECIIASYFLDKLGQTVNRKYLWFYLLGLPVYALVLVFSIIFLPKSSWKNRKIEKLAIGSRHSN